jgi:hypothetical protein
MMNNQNLRSLGIAILALGLIMLIFNENLAKAITPQPRMQQTQGFFQALDQLGEGLGYPMRVSKNAGTISLIGILAFLLGSGLIVVHFARKPGKATSASSAKN